MKMAHRAVWWLHAGDLYGWLMYDLWIWSALSHWYTPGWLALLCTWRFRILRHALLCAGFDYFYWADLVMNQHMLMVIELWELLYRHLGGFLESKWYVFQCRWLWTHTSSSIIRDLTWDAIPVDAFWVFYALHTLLREWFIGKWDSLAVICACFWRLFERIVRSCTLLWCLLDIYDITKFDGTNFQLYKNQMQDVLVQKKQKLPILYAARSEEMNLTQIEWEELDELCRSTIRLCTLPSQCTF